MKVIIANSWILTDEHSQSSHGIPVLIAGVTKIAFDPADIAIPPTTTAGAMIARWASVPSRPKYLKVAAAAYCAQWPEGPQVLVPPPAARMRKLTDWLKEHQLSIEFEGRAPAVSGPVPTMVDMAGRWVAQLFNARGGPACAVHPTSRAHGNMLGMGQSPALATQKLMADLLVMVHKQGWELHKGTPESTVVVPVPKSMVLDITPGARPRRVHA